MKHVANDSGIALLMTLAVITVLIAGALEWNRRVRRNLSTTTAIRNNIVLTQLASAGVHFAMAVLVRDRMDSDTDSIQEFWADDERLNRMFQQLVFPLGTVRLTISDELGKLQVNALVEFPDKNKPNNAQMFLWDRFLTNYIQSDESVEDVDASAIINAIKDWIDSGDDDAVTGLTGAESSYYKELDPPYGCRNGPIPDLSDLQRVKGITANLLHGKDEAPGISGYITEHGIQPVGGAGFAYPGRINVGTAPLPVLAALMPLAHEDLAEVMDAFRAEMAATDYVNDISAPEWYRNVPGYNLMENDKKDEFEALVSTSSQVFRIRATAEINEMTLVSEVVVERIQDEDSGIWKCSVLSWQNR